MIYILYKNIINTSDIHIKNNNKTVYKYYNLFDFRSKNGKMNQID